MFAFVFKNNSQNLLGFWGLINRRVCSRLCFHYHVHNSLIHPKNTIPSLSFRLLAYHLHLTFRTTHWKRFFTKPWTYNLHKQNTRRENNLTLRIHRRWLRRKRRWAWGLFHCYTDRCHASKRKELLSRCSRLALVPTLPSSLFSPSVKGSKGERERDFKHSFQMYIHPDRHSRLGVHFCQSVRFHRWDVVGHWA